MGDDIHKAIDWNREPDANYHAFDADGTGHFFSECTPILDLSNKTWRATYGDSEHYWKSGAIKPDQIDWTKTLIEVNDQFDHKNSFMVYWSISPEAKYHAYSEGGVGYFFRTRPYCLPDKGRWNCSRDDCWASGSFMPYGVDWTKSLIERQKNEEVQNKTEEKTELAMLDFSFLNEMAKNWQDGIKDDRQTFDWKKLEWSEEAEIQYRSALLRHVFEYVTTGNCQVLAAVACNANILWHYAFAGANVIK